MNKTETKKILSQLNDPLLEEEAAERINKLNIEILKIDGLDERHFIDPSLLLKLERLTFEELWNETLEPVLRNLIHGRLNEEQILKKLELIYKK